MGVSRNTNSSLTYNIGADHYVTSIQICYLFICSTFSSIAFNWCEPGNLYGRQMQYESKT